MAYRFATWLYTYSTHIALLITPAISGWLCGNVGARTKQTWPIQGLMLLYAHTTRQPLAPGGRRPSAIVPCKRSL
jgi:hypothetical protein